MKFVPEHITKSQTYSKIQWVAQPTPKSTPTRDTNLENNILFQ